MDVFIATNSGLLTLPADCLAGSTRAMLAPGSDVARATFGAEADIIDSFNLVAFMVAMMVVEFPLPSEMLTMAADFFPTPLVD